MRQTIGDLEKCLESLGWKQGLWLWSRLEQAKVLCKLSLSLYEWVSPSWACFLNVQGRVYDMI